MNRSVLALGATAVAIAAVHTVQRHLQHREVLEMEMHKAHGHILEVAATHPALDPIWVRNHPNHVKEDESGALLMCQWWLESWRAGLNLGIYTPDMLRENARCFMADPVGLKAWALTRRRRRLQSRNRRDRLHVALLDAAYSEADGPSRYPGLEVEP
ncbi:DUF6082 family protein [Streptomyces sp. NPDC047525]|uniref:DUF6082 family protein n=1 Tax=Streptomyces sp. NPDC047525 TaxID=3155264 RepID=UPI003405F982